MPLPEEQKSNTPFKSRDIKTLFLAAGNRKRKASSPIPPSNEAKSVKICDKESDNEIQLLNISDNGISVGDSKENKDLNTVKNESLPLANGIISAHEKDKETLQKGYISPVTCEDDSKGSSDLNSSLLDSSMNALNTSGTTETNKVKPDTANPNTDSAKSESKTIDNNGKEQCETKSKKRKRMTPEEAQQRSEEREKKQQEKIQKKQELEAKKQERERELQERKQQKELERKAKELEKKAKEDDKKEKERLRLEKKEQEEKEKEMKLEKKEFQKRMRQMQIEQKLQMKKEKEELKQKQEEERKKAEEEKKKAEEEKEQKEKEKQAKAKAAFAKFFKKERNSAPPPPAQKAVEQEGVFKPFQISEDMTLAPVVPSVAQDRFNRERLDTALKSQNGNQLYLQILKSGSYQDVSLRKKRRKPRLCDADVIIMDESDQTTLHLTAKLLQFSENVRPPYFGTWRKKSKIVNNRKPFAQDEGFDYSVDSDDEWDEGGPGESLSGTEPEDESEEEDYEVDNEFFVPHGYLSAEEEKEEDEEGKEEVENDPEKQKALLKKKLQEFEMERKKKTTELKPIVLGCYIANIPNPQNNELCKLLEPYLAVLVTEHPIPTSFTIKKSQTESKPNPTASSPTSASSNVTKGKKHAVPEEAMPHLIRLIHGNHHGRDFLIAEFKKFWHQHCQTLDQPEKPATDVEMTALEDGPAPIPVSPAVGANISKRQLFMTIKNIASFKRSTEAAVKNVWWVNEAILVKYGLTDAPIPNTWTYLNANNKEEVDVSPVVKPSNASIKEFLVP